MVVLYLSIVKGTRGPIDATIQVRPEPASKARKPLSKCALAGYKWQRNPAERRFGALRREKQVPAGCVFGCFILRWRSAAPISLNLRWPAAGSSGPAGTQSRHLERASSALLLAPAHRPIRAGCQFLRRSALASLRDSTAPIDIPVAPLRGRPRVARRSVAVSVFLPILDYELPRLACSP